jgi:hypothetical protein
MLADNTDVWPPYIVPLYQVVSVGLVAGMELA